MIVAQTLTDQDVDDPSQVGSLLDQIGDPIVQVTADGAYDGAPTYQTIAQHGDGIEVVIPPRATAVPSGEPDTPIQRDRHLVMIAAQGRLAWQASVGYGQQSLVETTMGRFKTLIGPRLRARSLAAQQTASAVSGHKKVKGDKVVAFCDRRCNVIAPFVAAPGNCNESPLLRTALPEVMRIVRKIGIAPLPAERRHVVSLR
jgi:hypothetical protein